MKLKKLKVRGFRSLADFEIEFHEFLTIVVGENDAGKTSLIDCLKIITENKAVTLDDLTYGQEEIEICLELDDFSYKKSYEKEGASIKPIGLEGTPSSSFVNECIQKISSNDFDPDLEDNKNYLFQKSKQLGLPTRSNSKPSALKDKLLEKLREAPPKPIKDVEFPIFNSIKLDGQQFENIPNFFKTVFLKEKQSNIWQEKIKEDTTLEEFVRLQLEVYSNGISQKIQEQNLIDKLKRFLPELTDIKIEPTFELKDLNFDAKVKFLENGHEISIDRKGDGTKRRMTMALLELKKEQKINSSDEETVYLFDEPDTHLHVKAQLELAKTIQEFSTSGNQVVLTTHSPFILNSVRPEHVRILNRRNNSTSVKYISSDPDSYSKTLRNLGLENTHLFFSRIIIIVEGATEENFLPHQYFKKTGQPISSGLIKIINTEGINNIPGFAHALLELHDPNKIFILRDNDASPDLNNLIENLNISPAQSFIVGNKEFEDAFEAKILHNAWAQYHTDHNKQCPSDWTEENIENLKCSCLNEAKKFSGELKSLNKNGKKMTKPEFGKALGQYTDFEDMPDPLQKMLNRIIGD